MKTRKEIRTVSKVFLPVLPRLLLMTTLLLSSLGLFFVFEASVAESFNTFGNQYHFLQQQALWLGVGIIALVVASFIQPKFWKALAPVIYGVGIFSLILVFIPGLSLALNGAKRWISVAGIRFQPVEPFKFALLTFFASWLYKTQKIQTFLFFTGLPALLIVLQPDLGSLLVLVWIAFGMYFLAGGKLGTLSLLGLVGIVLVALAVLTSPYRMQRLTTYLDPEADPLGAGFHIRQITLALGNGGWFGQGLGNSRQKYAYIPEASSDSIFAIVAEELGFIGSIGVLALYLAYFYFTYRIVTDLPADSFEYLLGWGILLWLAGQTILNLAAIVALVPLTGLPLPFFSYGGSSLLTVFFATGIVVSLGRKQKV